MWVGAKQMSGSLWFETPTGIEGKNDKIVNGVKVFNLSGHEEDAKIAMNHMKEENNPQWVDEDAIMNSIINYINNICLQCISK